MKEEDVKKLITETVKKELQTGLFTARKLTDTPTDRLQMVNRAYITLNGNTANRPKSSVVGQHYFDNSLATNGQLIVWNGTGWVNGAGTYV